MSSVSSATGHVRLQHMPQDFAADRSTSAHNRAVSGYYTAEWHYIPFELCPVAPMPSRKLDRDERPVSPLTASACEVEGAIHTHLFTVSRCLRKAGQSFSSARAHSMRRQNVLLESKRTCPAVRVEHGIARVKRDGFGVLRVGRLVVFRDEELVALLLQLGCLPDSAGRCHGGSGTGKRCSARRR